MSNNANKLAGKVAVVTGASKGIASEDASWITGESLYITGGLR